MQEGADKIDVKEGCQRHKKEREKPGVGSWEIE